MSITEPARPVRTNDPEGTRRRLVDAAFEAFTTRGYHATSLHELKRVLGASGGALSHHFPAKRDLGLAVLRERVAPAVEETWIAPVLLAPTAAAGVQDAFAAIASQLEAQGRVDGCPLNNLALELSQADEAFRMDIAAVFEGWTRAIADKLRDDQRGGRAPSVDADDLAALVVAAYSGAMAMAKAAQDAQPLRRCARQLAQLEGLRPAHL
ncbi:MAG: TetR/AcrR family transcriptional regulator [Comamonadaceae bacterium]|nr:MAG: TetR/AcrR family transcriptional regulator [Comamonadaceae bacterium]